MYGHPDAVRHSVRMPYISFLILKFLNRCISVKPCLINTKLGEFVNLGVLFLTVWFKSCLSHNLHFYLVVHGLKSGSEPYLLLTNSSFILILSESHMGCLIWSNLSKFRSKNLKASLMSFTRFLCMGY